MSAPFELLTRVHVSICSELFLEMQITGCFCIYLLYVTWKLIRIMIITRPKIPVSLCSLFVPVMQSVNRCFLLSYFMFVRDVQPRLLNYNRDHLDSCLPFSFVNSCSSVCVPVLPELVDLISDHTKELECNTPECRNCNWRFLFWLQLKLNSVPGVTECLNLFLKCKRSWLFTYFSV